MAYGKLRVVCGPMFSGKSTELMNRARKGRDYGKLNTLVLKPSFDTRYSAENLSNHDLVEYGALAIDRWPTISSETNAIFIDEIQFMSSPRFEGNIVENVQSALSNNINVMVAGLDTDWKGNPFEITAKFLAMADKVYKKTAHCYVCGKDATKTFKKIANDAQVELGEKDLYQARCNRHWHCHGL